MKVVDLRSLAGQEILAGSPTGRRIFERLRAELPRDGHIQLFVVDFAEVAVATSSFLRESIVSLRTNLRAERPNLYLVVANLLPDVEEELHGLLGQMGEALWLCRATVSGRLSGRRLIGRLDSKVRQTLEAIEARGKGDAQSLWMDVRQTEPIGVTALHNRLATLSRQGLIVEERLSNLKTYHPLEIPVA